MAARTRWRTAGFLTLSRRKYGNMLSCKVTFATSMERRCLLLYFSEPDSQLEERHTYELV